MLRCYASVQNPPEAKNFSSIHFRERQWQRGRVGEGETRKASAVNQRVDCWDCLAGCVSSANERSRAWRPTPVGQSDLFLFPSPEASKFRIIDFLVEQLCARIPSVFEIESAFLRKLETFKFCIMFKRTAEKSGNQDECSAVLQRRADLPMYQEINWKCATCRSRLDSRPKIYWNSCRDSLGLPVS